MTTTFARVTAPTAIELDTEPAPSSIPSGHVEVTVLLCGVCGSDLHAFAEPDAVPAAMFGHEWVGTVTRVGSGVEQVQPGDRVIAAVGPACGACAMCRHGHPESCETVLEESTGTAPDSPSHGAFATTVIVSERRVTRALPELTDEQAAFIEPTAITFHAVKRTHQALGAVVLVQGAGPIGLLAAQHARHAGAGQVIISEPNPDRQATARALGFTDVYAPGEQMRTRLAEVSDGLGADVLYECTGVPALLHPSTQLVRRGGTVSLIGMATTPSEVSSSEWLYREITVLGSSMYNHEDFLASMRAVRDGAVDVVSLHTGTLPLTQLDEALSDLSSPETTHTKILIDTQQ